MSHYGLLVTLTARGPLSQRELAAHTVIDPRNLVALLDELEKEGLIERAALLKDRRVRSVSLSAKGQALLGRLRDAGTQAEREFLSALTPVERQTLHGLLWKLFRHAFEEEAPKTNEQ
jgi:DNA-binding MarR family transcriptional regulator